MPGKPTNLVAELEFLPSKHGTGTTTWLPGIGLAFACSGAFRSRRKSAGRTIINATVRAVIRQMAEDSPGWGAPRIHGELLKLGLDVRERTVSRYLKRLSPPVNAGNRNSR